MPADAIAAPTHLEADALPEGILDGIIDRALDHMAAGSPAEAIPHLRRALALAPNHPAATHALLRALEDSGQLDEALILVRQLIASDPDDPLAHTRLSILLQKSGNIPAAEAASARARILAWKHELQAAPEPQPVSSPSNP